MTQAQLAQASGLGTTIIKAFEAGGRRLRPSTLASLQRALEVRGVAFIAQDGGGPGVRLRDPITQPVSGESLLAA